MRFIQRGALTPESEQFLANRQLGVDSRSVNPGFNALKEWQAARRSRRMRSVLETLRRMTGERERCMYCLDSHGSDIEHFWPKTPYPERMFRWVNLLLCCTECGRLKGNRFPLERGEPMLIDPTVEDPWHFLDFEPRTGLITVRFDADSGSYSRKGEVTVEMLRLDRREALGIGYRRTWRRLMNLVQRFLDGGVGAEGLAEQLMEADDHGLLGWVFDGNGGNEPPFSDLRARHAVVWQLCEKAHRGQGREP